MAGTAGKSELDKQAQQIRARVADVLKSGLEKALVNSGLELNAFSKVEHVVFNVEKTIDINIKDAAKLVSYWNEDRLKSFASRLAQLREGSR